jgi:general secretion pathway protein A
MYEQWFGLRERPFQKTPDPRFLLETTQHGEACARLQWAIENGEVAVLTGDVGTGKSLISRAVIDRLPANWQSLLLVQPRLSALELVGFVAHGLGIEVGRATKNVLLGRISDHLLASHDAGERVVLWIDEAHLLSPRATIEELRLLLNVTLDDDPLLSLVLVGQPELDTLLHKKEHRALAQRIGIAHHLNALSGEETAAYIQHRMAVAGATKDVFLPSAAAAVFRWSGGVPRQVNTLAQACLLVAFGQQNATIDEPLVAAVWDDLRGHVGTYWSA